MKYSKEKKLQMEKQKAKARGLCGYWKAAIEQNPGVIADLDSRIAVLAAKRDKLHAELAIAPTRWEQAKAEYARLGAKIETEKGNPLTKKIDKFVSMLGKLKQYEKAIAEMDLTPEQIALLTKAAAMPSKKAKKK